jgi:hypothetical protein
LLLVWFGFFGAFLVGASWRLLSRYPSERLMSCGLLLYGLLFFVASASLLRRGVLWSYFLLMVLGALSLTTRLAYVALKRPSLYYHWEDWLLLAFMLMGMWSAVPASWRLLVARATPTRADLNPNDSKP